MKFTILVTSKCNLRCSYCYEKSKLYENMTFEIADKTIDFIEDRLNRELVKRPLQVIFHGGEPLLNFELVKYMRDSINHRINDREIIFDMTTNATVINDDIISFLKNDIDNLSVSIDGTKEINDANRIFSDGTGTYDIIIRNCKILLENNINPRVRMTYNSKNISALCNGITSIINSGIKEIAVAPDIYDNRWDVENITLLREQVFKINDLQNENNKISISLVDKILLSQKKGNCFGGINSFTIDEVGNIYPCTFCVGKKEFIIGQVNDLNISSKKTNRLIDIYKSKNQDCIGCSRYDNCTSSRCKIINKLSTGEYNNPAFVFCAQENVNVDLIKSINENI
ncbi:radical SAM/SPASM domain-containing protein [Metaclostridioides mangenotii]|uniref:radical SAM/SPASM domain-containing protein n=1 Tax=Metaclostridioides mangenotii TaxID=1540 RepID=UPI0026EE5177|nr:radical SAM protein [Clostridioides mangenotii]